MKLPVIDMTGTAWMAGGLCAETDPESFFPEKGMPTSAAKRTCMACEVRRECLEYALGRMHGNDVGQFGVWGGLSPEGRRRLLGNDRKAAAA